MNHCKNCNSELLGKFCQNCGLAKEPTRINGQYIVEEISSVLNFDKGIFYTIRELFIRPGATVNSFIDGDRKKIVKPIFYLIICSLLYTVAQQFFIFEAGYIRHNVDDQTQTPIMVQVFEFFSKNFGYANILMAIFIALWVKLFFRKYKYNYYEIYILLCFVMGNSILIYALLGIIESVSSFPILQIGFFFSAIYVSWAIGQFFDRTKKISYLKGFFSYALGTLSFILIGFGFGLGLEKLL